MEDRASSNSSNMMILVIILVISVIALLLLIMHVSQNNGLNTTASAQSRMEDPLCMKFCMADELEKTCETAINCVAFCELGRPGGMQNICNL